MTYRATEEPRTVELFAGHAANANRHRFPEISYLVEELTLNGYCVVPNQISESEQEHLRADVDSLLAQEEASFGRENLRDINDEGVVRSPFMISEACRKTCFSPLVFGILDAIFQDQRVLHVNRAVINDPSFKHPASVWHREPPYVDFTASRPLALTFIHAVDPSNSENGGLEILPGSHRWEHFPSDEYVRRNAVIPKIPAGAVLVINSLLFHRGTENQGADARRSFVTIFTSPVIKQQVDIPSMMREQKCESIADEFPAGRFLFGFDTELRRSDEDYRRNKLDATKRM